MKIRVSIYDEKHEKLFSKVNPHYDSIKKLNNSVVDIPKEDILVYSLFKEQKNMSGFRTYRELKEKLPKRIGIIEDYLDLDSHTITAKFGNAEDQKMVTESVGIGTSLSVISSIHSLTQADWHIKPVGPIKDFDYEIASDGNNIIEVECKGHFGNPQIKDSSVSKMKNHIENKKIDQKECGNENIMYGAITTYNNSDDIAHCRLLDPESNNNYQSPYKLRVLSRLKHYFRGLSFISNSHFLIALANRISTLEKLDDENFQKMNNQSLIRTDGQVFDLPVTYEYFRTKIPYMNAFGHVSKIGTKKYFLLGYRYEVVEALIKQNYDYLLSLNFKTLTITDYINALLKKQEADPNQMYHDIRRGYVQQVLKGAAYASSDGMIIGNYSSDKEWRME